VRRGAVTVEARAKLNLSLAVGPRRADGYHELATIFQSISLADTLEAEPRPSGFGLTVSVEDTALRGGRSEIKGTPSGAGNLVLRAAHAMAARFGVRGGAHFRLRKRIPVGSGLGGGSADAAAALIALRALHYRGVARRELFALAATLGADVPFAMVGGAAVGLGTGERLAPVQLDRFRALVAVPRWRVSTTKAYRQLDTLKYGLTAWSRHLRFAQRVAHKRITLDRALSPGNRFEAVLGTKRHAFESLRERMLDAGVARPQLTGSGSAVFGILEAGSSAPAVADRFRGTEALYLVHSTRAGVRLRSEEEFKRR